MIESIAISGVKFTPDEQTKRYVIDKIARLDRFLPRHARKSVSAEVKLREINRDHGNKYEAEVLLFLPKKQLTAKDSTVNMLAAVDIVEAKLARQMSRYKDAHIPHIGKTRAVINKLKRTEAPVEE